MNVISGKYRGKKLVSLAGRNTRPTMGRVKEDMFTILSNYFIYNNKTSLDLFGGSGALSLEGLSRGIGFAYVNDSYPPALKIIKQNLQSVDTNCYKLTNYHYLDMLEFIKSNGVKIDLIYLDPPFAQLDYYYDFFTYLDNNDILNNYGVVLIEAPSQLDLTKINNLVLLKQKNYKNKHLYFFRKEKGEDR